MKLATANEHFNAIANIPFATPGVMRKIGRNIRNLKKNND